MTINCFLKLVHNAQIEIKKVMSQVDVIIEALDARTASFSTNPMIQHLKASKPNIEISN